MNNLVFVFSLVTTLFFVLLAVKSFFKLKFCVICASVSLSWIVLLILFYAGIFYERILLGLLIGQSIVGMYYLLEKKLAEKFRFFRLPFLLSATLIGYVLLIPAESVWYALGFLILIWLLFGSVFYLRSSVYLRGFAKKILECCKNW